MIANKKQTQQRKVSITKSFEYIGNVVKIQETDLNIIRFNADAWKEVSQNQISLF